MTIRPFPLILIALCAALPAGGTAQAGSLKADYAVSVRGLPVGRAELRAAVADRSYSVEFSGRVSGLARLFFDASAHGEATGTIGADRPHAESYSHVWVEDDDTESVSMRFVGNGVAEIAIEPPRDADERVVPMSGEDKADAIDMVSSFLWPAAAGSAQKTCNRTLPLIDGKRRFDVASRFSRTEWFSTRRGQREYRAIVCRLSYRPVSGHRTDKEGDGLLSDTHDVEVWLAAVGDGLVAPVRVQIGSRFGRVVLEATKFEAE